MPIHFVIFFKDKSPLKIEEKEKTAPSTEGTVLVETTGLEPVTPCMSSKYSNQLSYASRQDTPRITPKDGGDNRTRTCDPLHVKQVL